MNIWGAAIFVKNSVKLKKLGFNDLSFPNLTSFDDGIYAIYDKKKQLLNVLSFFTWSTNLKK